MPNVAIAAAANANASIAAAEAARARRIACQGFVRGYAHDTAAVAEMRQYAGCVSVLHPRPVTDPTALLGIKVAIVLVMVGAGVGIWRFARNGFSTLTEAILLGGLLGAGAVAGVLFALFLVVAGVSFIFS